MILYAMLYGRYPFDAKEPRFARKIVAAEYTLLPVCADAANLFDSSLPKLYQCHGYYVAAG